MRRNVGLSVSRSPEGVITWRVPGCVGTPSVSAQHGCPLSAGSGKRAVSPGCSGDIGAVGLERLGGGYPEPDISMRLLYCVSQT